MLFGSGRKGAAEWADLELKIESYKLTELGSAT